MLASCVDERCFTLLQPKSSRMVVVALIRLRTAANASASTPCLALSSNPSRLTPPEIIAVPHLRRIAHNLNLHPPRLRRTFSQAYEQSTATQKRGRREEGGAVRVVKPRRGGSNSTLDTAGGAPGGGGSVGAGGHDQQLLLRDRRSRLAARALRSSGNFFDTKGIAGAGWLAGVAQEQPEPELRVVVKVAERENVVDPPAVPACLSAFLSARRKRRSHEVRCGHYMHAHRNTTHVFWLCHVCGFFVAIM